MKKLIILISLIATVIVGCKKDESTDPTIIQPGVWLSVSPHLQYTIRNLKGEGDGVQSLEYTDNSNRFLKFTYSMGISTYRVMSVYNRSMVLIDSKDSTRKEITFIRQK